MPTNDERGKIAETLRSGVGTTYYMSDEDFIEWLFSVVRRSCDGHILESLAYLIEPEERTCLNVSDDKRGFICSGCGTHVRGGSCCHSYVDDAGTRWYTTADKPGWNFCPNCGARVIQE